MKGLVLIDECHSKVLTEEGKEKANKQFDDLMKKIRSEPCEKIVVIFSKVTEEDTCHHCDML